MKGFKSDNDIVEKLFPSLPRLFQRNQTCKRDNRQGISV